MMSVILKNLSQEELDTYGLVLSSDGIAHRSRRTQGGWDIWVKDTDYEKAVDTIAAYVDENQNLRPDVEPLYHGEFKRTFTGVWVSMILLLFYVATALGDKSEFFIKAYGSSASHILNGELFRSVTALMIHASTQHILGNIVGVSLFATSVCSIMGLGVGWFMILVTGMAGNLINALLRTGGHISVGASTSIFGAIGILSAYQFFKKFRAPGQRIKAFLPLCGGLALLGILGSGKHSDLMAHLFGFLSGIIAGSITSIFVKPANSGSYQIRLIILVIFIITASWMKAF